MVSPCIYSFVYAFERVSIPQLFTEHFLIVLTADYTFQSYLLATSCFLHDVVDIPIDQPGGGV
jgi:hypothetical protein